MNEGGKRGEAGFGISFYSKRITERVVVKRTKRRFFKSAPKNLLVATAQPVASGPLILLALEAYLGFAVTGQGSSGLAKMPVHSQSMQGLERRAVPQPLGESKASWSKVSILLPALRMQHQAQLLTHSAQSFSLGTLVHTFNWL